jgi:hypothetical protein
VNRQILLVLGRDGLLPKRTSARPVIPFDLDASSRRNCASLHVRRYHRLDFSGIFGRRSKISFVFLSCRGIDFLVVTVVLDRVSGSGFDSPFKLIAAALPTGTCSSKVGIGGPSSPTS